MICEKRYMTVCTAHPILAPLISRFWSFVCRYNIGQIVHSTVLLRFTLENISDIFGIRTRGSRSSQCKEQAALRSSFKTPIGLSQASCFCPLDDEKRKTTVE
jgi:hypothetical protein